MAHAHGYAARHGNYHLISLLNVALAGDPTASEVLRKLVPQHSPNHQRIGNRTLVLYGQDGSLEAVYSVENSFALYVFLPVFMSRSLDSMIQHIPALCQFIAVLAGALPTEEANAVGFGAMYYAPTSTILPVADGFVLRRTNVENTALGAKLPCHCQEYFRQIKVPFSN